jgi:hypothetical protein
VPASVEVVRVRSVRRVHDLKPCHSIHALRGTLKLKVEVVCGSVDTASIGCARALTGDTIVCTKVGPLSANCVGVDVCSWKAKALNIVAVGSVVIIEIGVSGVYAGGQALLRNKRKCFQRRHAVYLCGVTKSEPLGELRPNRLGILDRCTACRLLVGACVLSRVPVADGGHRFEAVFEARTVGVIAIGVPVVEVHVVAIRN